MKKLMTIMLFLAIAITSCTKTPQCGRGPEPTAPYGTPDDKYEYVKGDYRVVEFTYRCHGGKYIIVTYTSEDACSAYEKSEFKSTGICK